MPKLAVAMTPERAADVCSAQTKELLEDRFTVTWAAPGQDLAGMAAGADVVLTSWGTPPLAASIWADGDGPKVVAHAAGSVKRLVDPAVFEHGVAVFSAGGRIAWSVGEYCLAAMLTLARRLPQLDDGVRSGAWKQPHLRGHELAGATVGLLGASSTARALITLLAPFGCDVVVYDPYLDADRAAALGVRTGSLEEALGCAFVSLHVPDVPATRGLVSRKHVELIPDGSVIVNSARGPAVDQAALLEHLLAGRLLAALDVYDPEPPSLPADVLASPNLLLTPHIAGDTAEGHLALAGYVMADVLRYLESGQRGPSFVDPASWSIAA
ncbi:hydroxyacid dehydrogenase [Pseudonocardia sp. TRM90224]|uniref:hydroxyacid dehydrogenase n=1 Tax=Pseudonocardia sp. TRM90224 TaxID=2812678 RepID=UPI001E52288F|nr:hydroxyacid dehydrogenase [Pseudonocardia sp. TRM90224]